MQQYADLLTQRLQQRQAMRATEAVPLTNGRARREDSDSDFDNDEPAPSQRQAKPAKGAKRQRAPQDQQV